MRIYEISKELGIATKDILEALAANGFEAKNHMSVLSAGAIDFLHKKFGHKGNKVASPVREREKISPQKIVEKSGEAPDKTSTQTSDKKTEKKIIAKPIDKTAEASKANPKKEQEAKKEHREFAGANQSASLSAADKAETSVQAELILKPTSVADIAASLSRPVTEIIVTLLKWGIITSKNQIMAEDVVARIAEHYQVKIVRPAVEKEPGQKMTKEVGGKGKNLKGRSPVVVVVGHVDHGKTTLLDFIRKTRVAAKEKGGITQHLGAYQVHMPQEDITFLDTPGHEAFPKIRMRGLRAADIAVLVVAADDGVMPQTIEAIKFAKSAEVPVIVAINKVDKVEQSRLEVLRRQLAQYDLLPEEWGGDVVCVPVSAKTGQGVDRLLEMIVLQSHMMELQADVSGPGVGFVLEAKVEKGRGPVATLICQHGTVSVGDYFLCGRTGGKVSSLVNSFGERLNQAGVTVPVQVAGFVQLPDVGDSFEVVTKEQYRNASIEVVTHKPAPERMMAEEGAIALILKADNDSSKEAIVDAMHKLSKKIKKNFTFIQAGLGDVVESDVDLAADTGAAILAFHVKTEQNSLLLAQQRKVSIYSFYIIYKLLEFLEELAQKDKAVTLVRKKIGEAIVVRVFAIKGIGVIAGCRVRDGRFSRDGSVVIYRLGKKIGEGKIKSLQREKKSVKEVHAGFECGFLVEGFVDFAIDDTVECFLEVPQE
jgi:translation initiation factor IF-2